MTLQQDSSHPTGISDDTPRGNSDVTRARLRKARAAMQLRRDGYTWDQIAKSVGYPTGRAALVATELALENELKTQEGREFMRHTADQRFERLLRSVWAKAIDPQSPEQYAAQDRARSLIKDLVDLHGLAAPKQSVVVSPTATQLEAWVSQILQIEAPPLEEADIFDAEVVEDSDAPPA